jgi:hypothetical protein
MDSYLAQYQLQVAADKMLVLLCTLQLLDLTAASAGHTSAPRDCDLLHNLQALVCCSCGKLF